MTPLITMRLVPVNALMAAQVFEETWTPSMTGMPLESESVGALVVMFTPPTGTVCSGIVGLRMRIRAKPCGELFVLPAIVNGPEGVRLVAISTNHCWAKKTDKAGKTANCNIR